MFIDKKKLKFYFLSFIVHFYSYVSEFFAGRFSFTCFFVHMSVCTVLFVFFIFHISLS